MRAADFISQDMLKDMLEDMVPETSKLYWLFVVFQANAQESTFCHPKCVFHVKSVV